MTNPENNNDRPFVAFACDRAIIRMNTGKLAFASPSEDDGELFAAVQRFNAGKPLLADYSLLENVPVFDEADLGGCYEATLIVETY